MKSRWIIQNNLIAEDDLAQMRDECLMLNVPFHEVKVTPFSDKLPDFPLDNDYENIYYGSTTLMNNVYNQINPVGLFFNESFSMKNYIAKWGKHMLNEEAKILTIDEFLKIVPSDELIFIRPDGDGKEFDGNVMSITEAHSLFNRNMNYDSNINLDTKIIYGPPYNIHREWRNYVVNGEIVTSTRYRNNFKLSKSGTDIPPEMIEFTKQRILEYQPHDVFAIDIAEVNTDTGIQYYIIECGCMNSVGFYSANIKKYIRSITAYIEK